MNPGRLFCLSMLALALNATAQNTTNTLHIRPISLEEAIQMAIDHNFDLQIQRFDPQIAGYALSAGYAIYEPTLLLSAEHRFNSSPGGTDPQGIPLPPTEIESDAFAAILGPGLTGYLPTGLRYQLGVNASRNQFTRAFDTGEEYRSGALIRMEQPLLRDFWIDAPRAQIQINRQTLRMSEWALLGQMQAVINSVELAYYNLIFTRENVRVQETALNLSQQLLRETRKRIEVGTLAPLDELQAEAEEATRRAQLIEAQRALDSQENTLKNLITSDFASWHHVRLSPVENLIPVPATYDVMESWRKGLTMRPDLQQMRHDLERRDINLRFQRNQLFPALDLVGSYGHNALNTSYGRAFDDLARGDNPQYSAGVVMRIPLGNISARNRYRSGQAEKQQGLLLYKQLEQDIMVQIDDAIKLAQSAFQRVEATRQARRSAEAAFNAEQRRLEAGKSTSFFVLQFQRDLTAAQFEEIRALAEYNIALAQLAFREGTTFERHRLEIDLR
jgi:outer membrane protein TolC